MKNLLFLFFIFFVSKIFGQILGDPAMGYIGASWISSQPNCCESKIEVRDFVKLLPGFKSDGKKFTAKTEPWMILPLAYSQSSVSENVPAINKYLAPINLAGSGDVSAGGAATYTLPIDIPPGIKGIQPNLSVVYNSQAGDGILGWGFALAGTSAIVRTGCNMFNDGRITGIQANGYDRYSWDGQRLMLTDPEQTHLWGTNNSKYRTTTEDVIDITLKRDNDNSPEKFNVVTKDRLTMEYGFGENAITQMGNVMLITRLTSVKDEWGNTCKYFYGASDLNEIYLKRIEYTSNDQSGLRAQYAVNFYYDKRTESRVSYMAGTKFKSDLILRKVQIEVASHIQKTYLFSYYFKNNKSFLEKISLLNASNEEINPIVFQRQYEEGQIFLYRTKLVVNDDDAISIAVDKNCNQNHYFNVKNGDLRGYHINDKGEVTTCVSLNNPANGVHLGVSSAFKRLDITYYDHIVTKKAILDGNNDFIGVNFISGLFSAQISSNSPNSTPPHDYMMGHSVEDACKYSQQFGDFNGDGISDILMFNSTIGKFSIPEVSASNYDMKKDSRVYTADFNGNGKTDILVFKDEWTSAIWEWNGQAFVDLNMGGLVDTHDPFQLGDFNGDGLTDILKWYQGAWTMLYSNGKVTEQQYDYVFGNSPPPGSIDQKNLWVADINNDGLSDMVYYISDMFHVLVNTGKGFALSTFSDENVNLHNVQFADMNYDQCVDLVYNSSTEKQLRYLSFNLGKTNGLMSNASDGFGNKTSYEYDRLTNPNVYEKSNSQIANVEDLGSNSLVVKSLTVSNAGFNTKRNYKYFGLRYNTEFFNPLGFQKIQISDVNTGIVTETEYEIDDIFFNIPFQKRSKTIKDNVVLNSAENTYLFEFFSYRMFNMFPKMVVKNDQLNNIITTTEYFYSGNKLSKQITTQGEVSNTTEYGYESIATLPYYRATQVKTTASFRGQKEERLQTFTYKDNTSIVPDKNLIDPNSSEFSSTLELFYNEMGLLHTSKLDATFQKTYYHDPTNGLCFRVPNLVFGKNTDYVFDPKTLQLKYTTDVNGFKTEFLYDSWNKNYKTIKADGTFTQTLVKWCNGGDAPAGSLHFTESSGSGLEIVYQYFDSFGRLLRKVYSNAKGSVIFEDTEYNNKGQISRKSLPYFKNSTPTYEIYSYDNLNRIDKVTSSMGTTDYSYGYREKTITTNGIVSKEIINAEGRVSESYTQGQKVTYQYFPNGQVKSATTEETTVSFEYDLHGNRTKLIDPDAGTVISEYDKYDRLIYQKDNKGYITRYTYDNLNRVLTKTDITGIYTYKYDQQFKGLTDEIQGPNTLEKYTYDALGRMNNTSSLIESNTYSYSYDYNSNGEVSKITYPNGFAVQQFYSNGYLNSIKTTNNQPIWSLTESDEFGRIKKYSNGNNIVSEYVYSPSNQRALTNIKHGSLVDMYYGFDNKGNLYNRANNKMNYQIGVENFEYDAQQRLTKISNYDRSIVRDEHTYFPNGNIETKQLTGTFQYNLPQPHAVSEIVPAPNVVIHVPAEIKYNHQGMSTQILDGIKKMDFTYDMNGKRNTMKYYENNTLKRSKIYCGLYEKETDANGTKEICYVSTPAGVTSFNLKTGTSSTIYYQHFDHQGSPLVLTDQGGNKIFEQSFDAWGRRRNPTDYSYNNISLSSIPLRGYTGHEMIDEFGLINMNGRIYDPQLCRFLAPDRFVQAPGNSQSFNRYSYCLNNPLKYVDPSGHSWLSKGWNEFKQMNAHDKWAMLIIFTPMGGPLKPLTTLDYLIKRGNGKSHTEAIHNTTISFHVFANDVFGSPESELPKDQTDPSIPTADSWEAYRNEYFLSTALACNDCGGVTDTDYPPDGGDGIPWTVSSGEATGNWGFAIGTSFTASIGPVGFTYENGRVYDGKEWKAYSSFGWAMGLELSQQSVIYAIKAKPGYRFSNSDWAGKSYNFDVGYKYYGYGSGGNTANGYPEDAWKYSYSADKVGFGLGLGIGSYTKSYTQVYSIPIQYDLNHPFKSPITGYNYQY